MNVFEQIKQELNDCKEQSKNLFDFGISYRAYSDAFEIVERVEKQHNNGWIPVGEDGSGAFYIGDEVETCVSQMLFVNAWTELPEPYKECEEE